jgi:hypothetical protein
MKTGVELSNISTSPQKRRNFNITKRWYGFGWVQRTYSSFLLETEDCNSYESITTQFLSTAWLRVPGISVFQTRPHSYGQWTYTLTPIYVVPNGSPIFPACEAGNMKEVERLFAARKATIYDMNENGWTLLYVRILETSYVRES